MASQSRSKFLFFSVLISTLIVFSTVNGSSGHYHHLHNHRLGQHHHHHHLRHRNNGSVKLFVFGDSYVDTGNLGKYASSWKEPYGSTFPGKPAGRFSDGRVFTDYIAQFLGIRSPLPYRDRKIARSYQLANGMNFAYGGTGVFKTLVDSPNMTTQIDFFQQLVEQNVYTKQDLDSSVALVSLAGNDYITFIFTNGTLENLPYESEMIIKQLAINLKRIHQIGVKKVAVTALQPVGCLPVITSIFTNGTCDAFFNNASEYHNLILRQAVAQLNKEFDGHRKSNGDGFVVLDLYHSFNVALQNVHHKGSLRYKFPLKQCCAGSSYDSCGNVDDKGVKQYTICNDPELSFFWDGVHPAQSGWRAVYEVLQPQLHVLYL